MAVVEAAHAGVENDDAWLRGVCHAATSFYGSGSVGLSILERGDHSYRMLQQVGVHENLTPAERDVLALVRAGFSNAEIAARRRSSESTVANQVSSLLKKARVPTRRVLASLGDTNGAGQPT